MSKKEDKILDLRTDYLKGNLTEENVDPNPIVQFEKSLANALQGGVPEPHAMCLSSVNAKGHPSARLVLLRGIDSKGFRFYTHYGSQKGRELQQNPHAALTFFWGEMEQQVRVEGSVVKTSAEESDTYFMSRPRESRIGAWVSPQSKAIESREWLEEEFKKVEAKFENKEVNRPEGWGGFLVVPSRIEFWQGRGSRLHDRISYRKVEGKWVIERLAP